MSLSTLLGLQKATLTVVQGLGAPPLLKFKYNPTEYSITKSAQWNRPPVASAASATEPQFTGSLPATVQMEIFFDAFEELMGDVSGDIDTLLEWTKPTELSISMGLPQPPLLAFNWGMNSVFQGFQGFLQSVTARYTMFRIDGTPVRATANITLEEVSEEAARQNPTSGSLQGRRSHVVVDGDTLHSIAYAQFGEAAFWRGLASFNDIDDPMRIRPGTRILVPTSTEAGKLSKVSADGTH
jgi:nucleoid-associated protein YgaU